MLRKLLISTALLLTVLTSSPPASAASKFVISKSMLAKWQKVAICEEGGNWNYFTYWYPNALGIDKPNWIAAGGKINKSSSRMQQIIVANKFIKMYNIGIPDQYGCHPW